MAIVLNPRPGDVLLTADRSWLSRLIRWGTAGNGSDPDGTTWSHAVPIVTGGRVWQALEVAPPVCDVRGESYYVGRTYTVLRPPITSAQGAAVAWLARDREGVPYGTAKLPGYALEPIFRGWMRAGVEAVCSAVTGACLTLGAGIEWRDDEGAPLDPLVTLTPQAIARQARREGWAVVLERWA